jgi:hypothetical protein
LLWLTALLGMALGWGLDHVRHENIERENVTQRNNVEMLEKTILDLQRRNAESFNQRLQAQPPEENDPSPDSSASGAATN